MDLFQKLKTQDHVVVEGTAESQGLTRDSHLLVPSFGEGPELGAG